MFKGNGFSYTVSGCAHCTTSLGGDSEIYQNFKHTYLCPRNLCLGIYIRDAFDHLSKGKFAYHWSMFFIAKDQR